VPQIGVSEDRVAQHVDVYFYVDKELLVNIFSRSNASNVKDNLIRSDFDFVYRRAASRRVNALAK